MHIVLLINILADSEENTIQCKAGMAPISSATDMDIATYKTTFSDLPIVCDVSN